MPIFPQLPSLRGLQPRRFGLASWSNHVPFAFDLVAELRPKLMVELGTHSGESYFAFCQAVSENDVGTSCYAVDTWKGDEQAGFYDEDVYQDVLRHNQEFYQRFSYLVRSTFDEAVTQFADGTIDLLHIDGLHTYEAVKHDFETWLPKVSPAGIVLFHDVAARHADFGAWKFWEELSSAHGSFTFQHGWGLGVWRKDPGIALRSPYLEAFFSGNPQEADSIRAYYSLAAENLRLHASNRQLRELVPPNLLAGGTLINEAPILESQPHLRIYFPVDGTYREDASSKFALDTGKWTKLEIPLPTDWKGAPLRIDPMSTAGLIEIASLRIASRLFDHTIWDAQGRSELLPLPIHGTARLVSDERFLRLLSYSGDPQIFTPAVNCEAFEEPLKLEISLRASTDWPALAKVLQGWAAQLDRLPALGSQVEALQAELAQAQGAAEELAAARRESQVERRRSAELSGALLASWQFLLGVETELAQRDGLRRRLEEQLHSARESLAASHDQLIETGAHLRDQRRARREADAEIAAFAAEVTGLHGELAASAERLAAERGQVDVERERLRQMSITLHDREVALDNARHERDADHGRVISMQKSGSWKLTLPLRVLHRSLTGRKPAAAGSNGAAQSRETFHPAAPCEGNGALAATSSQPKPRYKIHFDQPVDWKVPERHVRVRGWYLPLEEAAAADTITVRYGDQAASGRLHIARPDVVAHFKFDRRDVHCGFEVDIELPAGPSQVVITASEGTGNSWVVAEFAARAPYGTRSGRSVMADPALDYARWIELYDTPGAAELRQMRERARSLAYQPLISVLMPVYNSDERWLATAIESVRRQVYANWELCIADDASTHPEVRTTLRRHAAADSRIKVCYRPENGHISAASNSALELASGEFAALLDHDDELAPHALFAVALELNKHPETDLIYSDEDKIDEEGRRFDAYFKPDWNHDLLEGQNYISHLGIYRASRLREVGGFRVGFEGAQDWDLALRVIETVPAERIRHIPRVLYHWRAVAGSTALVLSEKDYIAGNSRRLLEDHCQRMGIVAQVEAVPGGHCRMRRALPDPAPLISIVIPTRNRIDVLRPCMESILERSTYQRYEIILIDNQSDDPDSVDYLEGLHGEDIRVLSYNHPFNFSAMNNFAVAQARGELVCLLNNDMEVITPDWLEEMASHACRPEIGAVGAMLYYPNDTIQHAGAVLGIGGVAGHAFKNFPRGTDGQYNRARLVQNYTAVTAACLMIRRSTFQEVGGFEEKQLRVGFNDIDFCLRVHAAGYRNLWTPFAELYHHESVSRGLEDTPEKHERFQAEVACMRQRWGALLDSDPAYNPNLTLLHENFCLSWPPRTPDLTI